MPAATAESGDTASGGAVSQPSAVPPGAGRRAPGTVARWRVSHWIALVLMLHVLAVAAAGVAAWQAYQRQADARDTIVGFLDPVQTAQARAAASVARLRAELPVLTLLTPDRRTTRFQQLYADAAGDLRAEVEPCTNYPHCDEIRPAYDQLSRANRATLAAFDRWINDAVTPLVKSTAGPNTPATAALLVRINHDFVPVSEAMRRERETVTVALGRWYERLGDAAAAFEVSSACGLGLLVLGLAVVLLVLWRLVTLPLRRLAAQTRRVSGGDFGELITPTGPADIRSLGTDLETMRRRIVDELRESTAAREKLDAQTRELQRSNAELEQFAYVASHDLQEPLRKVASFCQLLERRYADQLDERARGYIRFAVDGARRMQQLINDLLAFSRVGRQGQRMTDVDVTATIERVRDELAVHFEETGAVIEARNLPAVHGDPILLRQLFQNLISNALKFRGEEPPRVTVTARPVPAFEGEGEETSAGEAGPAETRPADAGRRPMYEFAFSDNGIDIDESYAERIFVIFQRLHARDAYPGTGIGLALCRKIVEYHGGTMWLDTTRREGHGTTFRFTLPGAGTAEHANHAEGDNGDDT